MSLATLLGHIPVELRPGHTGVEATPAIWNETIAVSQAYDKINQKIIYTFLVVKNTKSFYYH